MKSRALSSALAAAALFVLACAAGACVSAAPVPASLPASAAGFYPSAALVATEFGAVGDNSTLNTFALQKAIEAAAATPGGAIVIIPGPAVYRTGTLYLRSNVYLYFEAGAFLQATANSDDYDADWDKWDVVRGEGAVNTGLLGSALDSDSAARGGVVGPMWNMIASYDAAQDQLVPVMWQGVRGCRGECRPRGVAFVDSVNVTVASVVIRDSADWSSLYRRVTNLLIADLNITGSSQWANNDGIDLESCTNATLVRLNIDVGDDGIVFAAGNTNDLNHAWPEPPGRYTPLAHVRVADCRVRSRSSGLKFEAIFQAAHGRVFDVDIRNVEVHGSNRGLGFQQRTGGGPDASLWSDVFVQNLTVHSVFTRGTNWWGAGEPIWMTSIAEGARVDSPLGGIRNVTISQCVARAANSLLISALGANAGTIQDVMIDGLDLTVESLPAYRADPTLVRAIRDYRPIDDSTFPQFLPSPVVAVAVEGPVKHVTFSNAAIRYEVVEGQDGVWRAARRQAAPPAVPYWVRGMCFNATGDADVSFANLQCEPAF